MTESNPINPGSNPDVDPHKPADDTEVIYFQGSPKLRGELGKATLAALVGLGLILIGVYFWNGLGWKIALILMLLGVAAPWIPWLFTKTVRYRISNYRIDYERGLFSKNIDTLELWHVEDISFHQSLIDRILGVGTITVISRDETTPDLIMHGIPEPRPLFEQLKQRVIAVKRQRGVIKVDPG